MIPGESSTARRYRVLVADDSAVVRRLVVEALAGEPAIEVVATAGDGRRALELFDAFTPDLAVLDVEMPGLDGLAALREIRKRSPCIPVVMFSAQTQKSAQTTLTALLAGASDFVHKPTASNGAESARQEVRARLIPKIIALCESVARLPKTAIQPPPETSARKTATVADTTVFAPLSELYPAPVEIVAIGVSTGGPAALAELLPRLGEGLRVPIVIVQHMPPVFTRHLAESLARKCVFEVREAQDGERLIAGRCLIAPGDQHMRVESVAGETRIALDQSAPENSCRPAVDVLFRSVASLFKSRCLSLVMTGMGQDGLIGARAVRAGGGCVLAQSEASCVVWGMPGAVAREGLAAGVLDVEGLALEIRKRTRPNPLARAG